MDIQLVCRTFAITILFIGGCKQETKNQATPAANPRPEMNVLLITLDTTRADRLGCYGHPAAGTPTLDDLAQRGVRFADAHCQVPLTLPSHTCMMTGLYPPTSGIHVNGMSILGDDVHTLAAELKQRGYRTGAFVSAWVLKSSFGLARGFDEYNDRIGDEEAAEDEIEERAGDLTADAALAWLNAAPNENFFAWVHFFDPHHPYVPPSPYDEQFEDPYDGEIAFMDAQIARLTSWLDEHGLRERTLIVAVGDHGEAFGEHGEIEHGLFLYDVTTRVPLIFSQPGKLPQGETVSEGVRLTDLAPTILDLAGATPPAAMQGRSLRTALETGEASFEPIYAESDYARSGFGWANLRSFTTREWKYIEAPKPELYDRAADPDELENVIESRADVASQLRGALESFVASIPKVDATSASLSAEELRVLAGLGYAGGEDFEEDEVDYDLRDPKDMLDVYRGVLEAQQLTTRRQYAEVADLLAPLALRSPESDGLRTLLGEAYLKLGRLKEAERELRAGMRRSPDSPKKLCRLGDAVWKQGRADEALELYGHAAEVQHDYAPAHNKLGAIFLQKQQTQKAYEHFNTCVELTPHSSNALTNLANLSANMGKIDEALRLLSEALRYDPQFAPAHQKLWQILAQTKRWREAIDALRKACRAIPEDMSLRRTLAGFLIRMSGGDAAAAQEAIGLARQCCDAEPDNPQNFDLLGMTHAAAGDFVEAASAARQALKLAQEQNRADLATRIAQRLEGYEKGRRP